MQFTFAPTGLEVGTQLIAKDPTDSKDRADAWHELFECAGNAVRDWGEFVRSELAMGEQVFMKVFNRLFLVGDFGGQ